MYLGYQNGKIKFYTEEKLNKEFYNIDEVIETQDKYVLDGEEYVLKDEVWEEKQAQKERERLNMLSMTALDFIKVLQSFGLTLEQINAYLEANLAAKMQLTYCQNVYCGIVKALMPITVGDITITADMIETAFKVKNNADSIGGA